MINPLAGRARLPFVATAAAVGLVASMMAAGPAGAAPSRPNPRHLQPRGHLAIRNSISHGLPQSVQRGIDGRPASLPQHGRYAFLLRLGTASTLTTYRQAAPRGRAIAAAAARSQYAQIKSRQAAVINALPSGSHVLYKTHAVLSGVAVSTDASNYGALRGIRGVQAVYPIAPKTVSNSYAMPLQHAPQAWQAEGDLGANSTIAIIDTGTDYTHANLGGSGDPADYRTALANDTAPVDPNSFDHAKFDDAVGADGQPVGFYDFVGDDYNADPNPVPPEQPYQPVPHADSNPLDCAGHGSHVAGIAAGYGENPDGTTFSGDYLSLPAKAADYQPLFRIGPGMAPEAKILSYKVFGCSGSTDVVAAAIDRALDPNQDGNPSDHADVINMSLGADYGSPQDGDSVAANLASKAGITVVTAAGNGGDYYDVGGSPGDAVRTIDVAASQDDYSQIDSLHVSFNGTAQDPLGAERSVQYDWANKPDLSGEVAELKDDPTACKPLDAPDAATVNGKVAFVPQWHDAAPECGSIARADNLETAGATGFIFGSDAEIFSAGINGNADIPGVLITKSAAASLADALATATDAPVDVTSTSASDFSQLVSGIDDTLVSFSSRDVRGAGNMKPDVSAVGGTVFSTAMGTGNQGMSDSGTSMATPMVAGLAALVKSQHADWTPEEVKADIMNTAGQDVYTGNGHTGKLYAPNRVGAGRIKADAALSNQVLAFVKDNPGAVSVSFGPVAITGKTTLTKTVNVVNTSSEQASFTVGYHSITSVPGVSYRVSPSSITVGAGSTKTLSVKFVVTNAKALTKTKDATVARSVDVGAGMPFPREFLADASGRVTLTPANGYNGHSLRVPVYSAPRPASGMTQPRTLALPGSGAQIAGLKLSGHGVSQGSGAARIRSWVAGAELQATSGMAPTCTRANQQSCVHYADERSADLKDVGFTSDGPLFAHPVKDGHAYFTITTQRPWRTPAGPQEFDVLIDTNGDNVPDAVLYNTRFGAEDIFLSELVDITNPNNPFIRDDELIDDRFGDTDAALFDSDTMLLPIAVQTLGRLTKAINGFNAPALPGFSSSHTRIRYAVVSFGELGVVDSIGANANTGLLNAHHLTVDVARPGIEAVDFRHALAAPTLGFSLFPDQPGNVLSVRRDVAAYNADHGKGMLVLHLHNKVGAKAQVVTLKSKPKVALTLSKASVTLHHSLSAKITVADTAGRRPAGEVTLRRANGSVIKSGSLRNGQITFTWTPGRRGTFKVYATYTGDANYASGKSPTRTYKVT